MTKKQKLGLLFGGTGALILIGVVINKANAQGNQTNQTNNYNPYIGGSTIGSNTGASTATNQTTKKAICKGDKGSKVGILQNYLKYVKSQNLGKYGVDNDWGASTQKAVENVFGVGVTCFSQTQLDSMLKEYQKIGSASSGGGVANTGTSTLQQQADRWNSIPNLTATKQRELSTRIYKALHDKWHSEDEEAIYQVGREMCQKHLSGVAMQYYSDYRIRMEDDMKRWLSTAEYQTFLDNIQC